MNGESIATLVLYAIQAIQAGIAREAIIDDVRAREADGWTSEEISVYLKQLADLKLEQINAVQAPQSQI